MRLRKNQLKQYHLKKRINKKNKEGSSYVCYGDPFAFLADVYPAGGKLQAELYGEHLPYIKNVLVDGRYSAVVDDKGCVRYDFENGLNISEGDGIHIYASLDKDPDYKIICIKEYQILYMEIEKL